MNFNGFSNKRIPDLASAVTITGEEYVSIFQDGTLKKVTVSQISAGTGTIEGGVPAGGETGQFLRKSGSENYQTEWASISFTTNDITEGSGNLYWTNSRFDTRLESSNLNASNLSTGTVSTDRLPSIALQGLERLFVVGELSTIVDYGGICDHAVVWAPMTINAIDVVCPETPTTGTIVIDILYRATPGGPLTSLYTSNSKPSLSCNGYASWATFAGSNLPNTTLLAQGAIIGFKIVSAPVGAKDLYVTVR